MFPFKKPKPRHNIYLHARDKSRLGVAPPPVVIKKETPEWWDNCSWSIDEKKFTHRFGNVYDPKFWSAFSEKDRIEVAFPTARGCPAFADYMTTGYVFKLWTDLMLLVDEDGTVKCHAADDYYNSNNKIGAFERDSVFPTLSDQIDSTNIVKFDSDWTITGDPGVSVWFEGIPVEGLTQPWYTFQGIVPIDKYPLDIKWIFDWRGGPGNHIIKAGTPIIRVFPFIRTEFHLVPGADDFAPGGDRDKCPYFIIRKALAKNWPEVNKLTRGDGYVN